MKKCGRCKVYKEIKEFSKHKGYKDGLQNACKKCKSKESKKYYNTDTGSYKRLNRLYKHKYGITLVDYNIMFNNQEGKCDICNIHQEKLQIKLAVDHCHKTGEIRSLLCSKCNIGLGFFNDNLELMELAATYIRKHTFKTHSK